MPVNGHEAAQDKRETGHSAAFAAGILKKSIPVISLFAIIGGVGYHMSLPAGIGCAGFLVWVDLSISAYRGLSANR